MDKLIPIQLCKEIQNVIACIGLVGTKLVQFLLSMKTAT